MWIARILSTVNAIAMNSENISSAELKVLSDLKTFISEIFTQKTCILFTDSNF